MIAELTNHLWQSTIFALLVGLSTLAFRWNRAQVRYWLWLSASLKFLLPFSLLIALGNRLEWAPAARKIVPAPAVTLAVVQMSQPFAQTSALEPSAHDARNWTGIPIFAVWACGSLAVMLIRFQGWRRIRAAVSSSAPIDVLANLQVRSSPGLLEPGVVGLFRPTLLLPAGIAETLTPRQLEAVLAHELCHVRRRDNLTSAIHMIVETVFWFHPLVWWIGARLVEERERACDEAVLSLGNEPRDYAGGILRICKSYLESPLSCVSGVTGANLRKRIQAILSGRIGRELDFARKLALAGAATATLTIPIAVGIVSAPRIQAQSQLTTLKFETASIKTCAVFRKNGVQDLSSARFLSQCTTVERLIRQAYGLFANGHWNLGSYLTVAGGPAWTKSDLYEIDAKAARPQGRATMNGPMLQALLENRFHLTVHRETREAPVYALTVAQNGPNLEPFQGNCTPRDYDKPPSEADCATARGFGNNFHMKAVTTADLCAGFSAFLDRHVVDETGITGRFNIDLNLSGDDSGVLSRPRSLLALSNPTTPAPPPVPIGALRTAVKTLGLSLDETNGPGKFIVIDHVERPSRN